MKTITCIFLLAISSNLVGQVFHNTLQMERLIIGQPNTLALGYGISGISDIKISRYAGGDFTSYFLIERDEANRQLTITPRSEITVYDTIYQEWVEWEKRVRVGQLYCEFNGDTMFVELENLLTGELEWMWSVRDVNNPIKEVKPRKIDLSAKSQLGHFLLIITTDKQSYEQSFDCVNLERKPFVIFCGKNGGELRRDEVTVNSELWVNFEISERDKYSFPHLKVRNPVRPQKYIATLVFDDVVKEYLINGEKLTPELLYGIKSQGAKKMYLECIYFLDEYSNSSSKAESIWFTLK